MGTVLDGSARCRPWVFNVQFDSVEHMSLVIATSYTGGGHFGFKTNWSSEVAHTTSFLHSFPRILYNYTRGYAKFQELVKKCSISRKSLNFGQFSKWRLNG